MRIVNLQVKHLGDGALTEEDTEDTEADVLRLSRSSMRVCEVIGNVPANEMVRSESNVFGVLADTGDDDSVDQFYFDAEESACMEVELATEDNDQELVDRETKLLRTIDSCCPAWVDVYSSRSGYSKTYAIIQSNQLSLRQAQDCEDLVEDSKWAKRTIADNFSPRISSSERMRRMVGLALADKSATDIAPPKVQSFLERKSKYDNSFLRRTEPSTSGNDREVVQTSSFVARAISDRHWVEEWARVTVRGVSFYQPEKRRPHSRIFFSAIITVTVLPSEDCPVIPNHHFLGIATLGRTVYLMFKEKGKRDEWFDVISRMLKVPQADTYSISSCETNSSILADVDDPAEEFMHKSSLWSCGGRRILNCARFSLNNDHAGKRDPLEIVEKALRRALKVSEDSAERRRDFLVCAALLKDASLKNLSEEKKIVFFVNLYHVMILHAHLVLGLPDSTLKWISYFNTVAYQVADDVFSLTELEHSIIRARMSYPSQFLSRFVIPKSWYRFALTRADWRLNFALNCSSKSNPESVFIYNHDQLQEQLDAASRLYLSSSASLQKNSSRSGLVVSLPRICQWFRDDFGGSDHGLLQRIEPFLPREVQRALRGGGYSIRYLSWQYECQPLRLQTTE